MAGKSSIEWTDRVWNFLRGCTRVSPGCVNCYAERTAHRFSGEGLPYEGLTTNGRWNGKIMVVEKDFLAPLRWRKPWKIFVNSMSDLFHENVSDDVIDRAFAVMSQTAHHTYQLLTKRPQRMMHYLTRSGLQERIEHAVADLNSRPMLPVEMPLENVWLGISTEDQKTYDERMPFLLQTPAAVRWISAEPLIGPIGMTAPHWWGHGYTGIGNLINWLVCGGESGPGARPMHPDWARSLRDQCAEYGIPFFFKQWGEYSLSASDSKILSLQAKYFRGSIPKDAVVWCNKEGGFETLGRGGDPDRGHFPMYKIGKKESGSELDGKMHEEFP